MGEHGRMDSQLRDATFRWIADDVDDTAGAELRELVASAMAGDERAAAELTERMAGMPAFGTAGIRAPVRAGPNGMNRAVVVRTTAGVADWLIQRGRLTHHGHRGVVVVGRDARHGSEEFAHDTAAVFAGAGFDVRMLPEPLPTPVLAHVTRTLDAVAGVQITASHNPPRDNGYKLYLDGGVQLIAPTDGEIEAAISRTPAALSIPRRETWSVQHNALRDYLARVGTLPRGADRELRIVATALHGVGARPLVRALHAAGFTDVRLVSSQAEPDPDFPTVSFPNPEEPGAADAVLELATEVNADLAIALDPDADRCAIGVPENGGWRMLRGDETGVLLGDHVLSTLDRAEHPDPLVATTIVSSTMLRSIAAKHGVRYDETLTGFKWLVRAGDGLGTGLVYAYEEALGHCVDPDSVRDKDGISTAVLACDLAAGSRAAGRMLPELLDELSSTYGIHQTGQLSVRVRDLSVISETMRRLRADPPAELAGTPGTVRDLLPETDALVFTGDDLKVVIRPSGTEPKLKCYLQVIQPTEGVRSGEVALDTAKQQAADRLEQLHTAVNELVSSPTT